MKCRLECENCPFDSCITDDDDNIKESRVVEYILLTKGITSAEAIQQKKKAQNNAEYYQKNRDYLKEKNRENYWRKKHDG